MIAFRVEEFQMPESDLISTVERMLRAILLGGDQADTSLRKFASESLREQDQTDVFLKPHKTRRANLDDITNNLNAMQRQLAVLRRVGRRCPITRFGTHLVPMLLPVFTEPIALDGPPSTVGPDDEVAIEDVPELMAAPLAEFMWVALSVSGTGSFAVVGQRDSHGLALIESARTGFEVSADAARIRLLKLGILGAASAGRSLFDIVPPAS
jgi:hypothetical protein